MGECLTGHVAIVENPADLATKLIPGGQKRDYLIEKLLFDICDYWSGDERFPTSASAISLRVLWGFPSWEWEHDKYSWVGLDPYFSFWMVFDFLFDFILFLCDSALFISTCFHLFDRMRGLTEYARAGLMGLCVRPSLIGWLLILPGLATTTKSLWDPRENPVPET